ncbi:hypothetical protein [Afipia carboxidovorans]|nr:hypothetical protein [Afipia carboxidovorans]
MKPAIRICPRSYLGLQQRCLFLSDLKVGVVTASSRRRRSPRRHHSIARAIDYKLHWPDRTDTLEATWGQMKRQGYMYIPIIDHERRPLGTLSAHDVLQILLGETEHEEYLLRDYVMGIGYR